MSSSVTQVSIKSEFSLILDSLIRMRDRLAMRMCYEVDRLQRLQRDRESLVHCIFNLRRLVHRNLMGHGQDSITR